MAFYAKALSRFNVSQVSTAKTVSWFTYSTADPAATVLADGYFNNARNQLKADDIIIAECGIGTASDVVQMVVTAVPSSGDVTVAAEVETEGGGARAVVPTADGLTTGLILASDRFVEATSADAAHILTLPAASAATRGREIWIWVVASTNCELRTPATSGQTINNVDGDGTQEALLTHSQLYVCRQHLATGWLLQAFTALGAVATAIVPD